MFILTLLFGLAIPLIASIIAYYINVVLINICEKRKNRKNQNEQNK